MGGYSLGFSTAKRDFDADARQRSFTGQDMTADSGSSDRELVTSLPPSLNDVSVGFVAAMAEAGIEVAAPLGRVTAERECRYFRVGFVMVLDAGGVVAVPCEDATALQISEILRQAEVARLDGPKGPRWMRVPGEGWACSILEPAPLWSEPTP
ncbi:hypothetical protein AB0H76_15005 [Nocardia sp. NPDC050712]|uniref:hypothetical protein n=1 Tax=Nocardia sp. NPDC050712 TaxID=3155518 RepID=UPI0033DA6510